MFDNFRAMFTHPQHPHFHHVQFPLLPNQNPQQSSSPNNTTPETLENENYEALLSLAERLGKEN